MWLQARQAPITVVAGAEASLTIPANEEPPTSVVAGTDFGFEVGALDRFGNPTALTGSVSITLVANPGGSTLGGPTAVTANGATS